MTSTLPYFWNRCVDFYREVRRMPGLLKELIDQGETSIEFNDCRDSLRTLHDELPSLMPYLGNSEYQQLSQFVLEAVDRYNAYLALLRRAVAQEVTLDALNDYYDKQLLGWTECVFLDYVASLVSPHDDLTPHGDIIETAQQLLELKPNIAGIGVNLNALITWIRSRVTNPENRRTRP